MLRRIARLVAALGLLLCLTLAFTPLACGGSQEMGAVNHHGGEGLNLPDAIVEALKACAEKAASRLKEETYAFQFEVEVTEGGHAERVKLKDSFPEDRGMGGCLAGALGGLAVSPYVMNALLEQAAPPSGLAMGVLVLAPGLAMVPALLVIAGVSVVVGVTVVATKEVVEAVRRRRRLKERCSSMYAKCQDLGPPCTRRVEGSATLCGVCRDDCQVPKPYTFGECYQCGFGDPT